MELIRKYKGSDNEKQIQTIKWIYASLIVEFGKKNSKSDIEDIAKDICQIVNNTHSVFSKSGEPIGYLNPYLNLNTLTISQFKDGKVLNVPNLHATKPNKSYFTQITREFNYLMNEDNHHYNITIVPMTDDFSRVDLHSLENLDNDFWILAGASNLICEKYQIDMHSETPTFKSFTVDDFPCIEMHEQLLVIKYSLENRILYSRDKPNLDKHVLGHDKVDVFRLINDLISIVNDKEWTDSVKPLIEKTKEQLYSELEHRNIQFPITFN